MTAAYASFPTCKGPKLAFKIGNTHIYGAGLRDAEDQFNFSLIIRINDSVPAFPELVFNNAEAELALPKSLLHVKMPPMLHLVWPDFGEASIPVSWWDTLYKFLAEKGKAKKKPYKVLFYCVGGRGRTGTALSIIAGLHMVAQSRTDVDPVEFVRHVYCDTAVESNSQIEYVEAVTGLEVRAPSAFELEWRQKQANAKASNEFQERQSVLTSNYSSNDIRDTDWVSIDKDGEYYVNGKRYTGDEEIDDDRIDGVQNAGDGKPVSRDFGDNEKLILSILKGQTYTGTSVTGGTSEAAGATPDYEGPAHRLPLQQ